MSLRTSATRYAKALLVVAIQESDPARIEADLSEIVGAMTTSSELRRAMLNPAVPQSARVSLVRALSDRAGVQAPLAKLLVMLEPTATTKQPPPGWKPVKPGCKPILSWI
jgi:F0F1-type ATP synthase delta subunit